MEGRVNLFAFQTLAYVISIILISCDVSSGYGASRVTKQKKVQCPKNEAGNYKRIGETRFYVDFKQISTFEEARTRCENREPKTTIKMATINNIEEDAVIGRWLEEQYTKNTPTTAKFWIAAKFSSEKNRYEYYYKKNQPIEYHNLHEKYAHPIGRTPGCMTVGLPYPKNSVYGWGYTWEAQPCDAKHFAICETTTNGCDTTLEYDQDKERYRGIFPLSNRRFVLSWERENYEQADIFCKNKSLELYKPSNADTCLFSLINEHRPEITKMHFWAERPRSPDADDPKYCPAAVLAYETHNVCNCKWRYIVTAASDCNLKNAVLCEKSKSKDHLVDKQRCEFEEDLVLIDTKKDYHRSTDKVDYETAEAECRKHNFQIVTQAQLQNLHFTETYDETETYWTFNKDLSKCEVSRYDARYSLQFKHEISDCSTPQFFLCAKDQEVHRGSARSFSGRGMIPQQSKLSTNTSEENSLIPEPRSHGPKEQFLKYEEKFRYSAAEAECKENGMHVIEIDSKKNMEFVRNLAIEQHQRIWIRNNNPELTSVTYAKSRRHHKRGHHHPGPRSNKKRKQCLAINEDGEIESFYCHAKLYFVCEF